MSSEMKFVGFANINMSVRLDENKPARDGWSYYNLSEGNVLPFADSRSTVFEAATKVFAIAAQAITAKRKKGNNASDLQKNLAKALEAFQNAVAQPGRVFVEEIHAISGNKRWQRIIVEDLEDDDKVNGDLTSIRYYGEARVWYGSDFRSINLRNGGIYPLFVLHNRPAVVVEMDRNTIRRMIYNTEDGWLSPETFVLQKTKDAARPQRQKKADPKPLPAVDESNVSWPCSSPTCLADLSLDPKLFLTAETINCEACGQEIGPLLDDSTILDCQNVINMTKLTDNQLALLGSDANNITTVLDYINLGADKLAEILGVGKPTATKKLKTITELYPK